jgi:hypothetical protein
LCPPSKRTVCPSRHDEIPMRMGPRGSDEGTDTERS